VFDESEFRRWRTEGDRALEAAAAVAAPNRSSFLCEQAVQLGLKALLAGIGSVAKGHDLLVLAAALRAEGVAVPTALDGPLAELSRLYVPTRHADAHPAGSPGEHYTPHDAERARRHAKAVLGWVDEKMVVVAGGSRLSS
jgi:HEPN domain-containing protein